jgi:hypothetical protein
MAGARSPAPESNDKEEKDAGRMRSLAARRNAAGMAKRSPGDAGR